MHTIKDYTTDFMHYGEITVPAGTTTTNKTAMGIDKNYNFVADLSWVKNKYPEIANILTHDLTYHGIDIPVEYLDTNIKT